MKEKRMKIVWKMISAVMIFWAVLSCPGEVHAQIHSGEARKIGTWWEGNGKEFSSFDEGTADEFKAKFEELQNQGITSLIIDLRNNGGGIVDEALQIANYILDKDSVILYEVDKNNNEEVEKTTDNPIINMPIVLLTNENTASSSEILAGALKDHGKATIVGTKTYGKGVIQQLLTLPDGSGLKITSEKYLTPNRTEINKIGIEPDENVELPDTVTNVLNVERSQDTQLQKAIEVLNRN